MKKWRIDKVVGKEMEVVPFSVQKGTSWIEGTRRKKAELRMK